MTQMVTDPRTGGQKGVKSARFDLMPPDALAAVAEVYGQNAQSGGGKYPDRNWEKGYAWGLSFGALMRHLWAFWRGEDMDPDSGQHHVAHAAWHCLTLLAFRKRGIGTDDRRSTPVRPPGVEDMDDAIAMAQARAKVNLLLAKRGRSDEEIKREADEIIRRQKAEDSPAAWLSWDSWPTVYLCGTVSQDSMHLDWRTRAIEYLDARRIFPLSPVRGKNPADWRKDGLDAIQPTICDHGGFVPRDRRDVERADAVLLFFEEAPSRQSIGTWTEFGWATAAGKPVVVVSTLPEVVQHPFITRQAARVSPSLEDGLRYLVFLLRGYDPGASQ